MDGSVQAILDSVPASELSRALKERTAALTKRLGKQAAIKRAVTCPGCEDEMGVRERYRHIKACPEFLRKRAEAWKKQGGKRPPSEWAFSWGKK